ncbi:MAG: phosphoribosylformylglycinamidine synthase subunit PurQ [Alphaproteobacteria bacterium]|jgi:phosphoribosylformylglycinamidine synthase|nr:phosphoribosylformylglycinamidine synthase subunit PurQ [Alphaproteobacteria bacterium]
MKTSVIVFPGSNCDRDVKVALEQSTGGPVDMVWHGDSELPAADLIVLPGGFSYGDYLRGGAMAARSPVMREVAARAKAGVAVLGICNGFQVLTECGLLPGVLMRNRDLRFLCRDVALTVGEAGGPFMAAYRAGEEVTFPIAHNEGNFFTDDETLARLEGENRVAFRYAAGAPNGAANDIAGITDETGRILGLMPHPERAIGPELGGSDGARLFAALAETVNA